MKIEFSTSASITVDALAQMARGSLREERFANMIISGLCTDSKEADANPAFVALHGEHTDGHNYISSAVQNGCRCVIAEENIADIDANTAVIAVEDCEFALSLIAGAYRQTLSCKMVAVTGSVGKTTTKELIGAVLRQGKNTYQSEGNHNSVIGMPLSVLQISSACEYAVLEMGMSGFGEIERMSLTAEPDIAIITNIGTSHLELLRSRENICRAKLEVLCGLKKNGYLILNGDEPLLQNIKGKSYHTIYVSLQCEKADIFAQNIRMCGDHMDFDIVYQGNVYSDFRICVIGRHNIYACLYAFAVGMLTGLSVEQIKAGFLEYLPLGMRQNHYRMADITVIEDCYNASPESMQASVDVLVEYVRQNGGRSIAVLGDMLELGEASPRLHRAVGRYVAEKGVDRLFVLGRAAIQIATGAEQEGMFSSHIHKNPESNSVLRTVDALCQILCEGDTVLFKASRGIRMERVVEALKEHYLPKA